MPSHGPKGNVHKETEPNTCCTGKTDGQEKGREYRDEEGKDVMVQMEIIDKYTAGEWVICSLCGGYGCQACSPELYEPSDKERFLLGVFKANDRAMEDPEAKKHGKGHKGKK